MWHVIGQELAQEPDMVMRFSNEVQWLVLARGLSVVCWQDVLAMLHITVPLLACGRMASIVGQPSFNHKVVAFSELHAM